MGGCLLCSRSIIFRIVPAAHALASIMLKAGRCLDISMNGMFKCAATIKTRLSDICLTYKKCLALIKKYSSTRAGPDS